MPQAASPALLHRFLGIGMTLLAALAFGLAYAGVVPLLGRDEDAATMIGYVFVGLGGVMLAVVWLVLKPRVPARETEQSWTDYWSHPAIVQKALPVWFLGEGAGVLATVGYMLSGMSLLVLVVLLALLLFWLSGPNPLLSD